MTDRQRFPLSGLSPAFASRITFVDHREIIPGDVVPLPTFNSSVIEAFLHRIEGLSDTFLYLNDDMFVASPISYSDLIDPEGVPYSFVEPRRLTPLGRRAQLETARQWPDVVHHGARDHITADLFEDVIGVRPPSVRPTHVGTMLTRQAEAETLRLFADRLDSVLSHRLRSSFAVRWMVLSTWTALHFGWVTPVPLAKHRGESIFVNSDLHPDIVDMLITRPHKFVCINVTEARLAEYERLKQFYLDELDGSAS